MLHFTKQNYGECFEMNYVKLKLFLKIFVNKNSHLN